jgi:hypothetical protein
MGWPAQQRRQRAAFSPGPFSGPEKAWLDLLREKNIVRWLKSATYKTNEQSNADTQHRDPVVVQLCAGLGMLIVWAFQTHTVDA